MKVATVCGIWEMTGALVRLVSVEWRGQVSGCSRLGRGWEMKIQEVGMDCYFERLGCDEQDDGFFVVVLFFILKNKLNSAP